MSSIGEVCYRLGHTFLTSLVGNQWATSGLRVNWCSVNGGLIMFPLFLLNGNTILPMIPVDTCGLLDPHLYTSIIDIFCSKYEQTVNISAS